MPPKRRASTGDSLGGPSKKRKITSTSGSDPRLLHWVPNPPKTFPNYGKLPAELRIMITTLLHPPPAVIELEYGGSNKWHTCAQLASKRFDPDIPIFWAPEESCPRPSTKTHQINKENRRELFRRYVELAPRAPTLEWDRVPVGYVGMGRMIMREGPKWMGDCEKVYFNPRKDTIYLGIRKFWNHVPWKRGLAERLAALLGHLKDELRFLAIEKEQWFEVAVLGGDEPFSKEESEYIVWESELVDMFPKLEEFSLCGLDLRSIEEEEYTRPVAEISFKSLRDEKWEEEGIEVIDGDDGKDGVTDGQDLAVDTSLAGHQRWIMEYARVFKKYFGRGEKQIKRIKLKSVWRGDTRGWNRNPVISLKIPPSDEIEEMIANQWELWAKEEEERQRREIREAMDWLPDP